MLCHFGVMEPFPICKKTLDLLNLSIKAILRIMVNIEGITEISGKVFSICSWNSFQYMNWMHMWFNLAFLNNFIIETLLLQQNFYYRPNFNGTYSPLEDPKDKVENRLSWRKCIFVAAKNQHQLVTNLCMVIAFAKEKSWVDPTLSILSFQSYLNVCFLSYVSGLK